MRVPAVLLTIFLALAGAAPAMAAGEVTATARTDRTAIWVADRFTYTVEIVCRQGTDVLADDLGRDKLKLDGLDLVSSSTERTTDGDVTRYRVQYVLTTYHVDVPMLKIEPFSARYYVRRPGQKLEDAPPAGEVQIPGAVVAFRSLLPDDQPYYEARDNRPPSTRLAAFGMLQPIGVGLIVLSIVPVVLLAGDLALRARRVRRSGAAESRRQTRRELRDLLEQVRAADGADPARRREAFAQLDTLVRLHLADSAAIPARSLTPDEIAAAVEARHARVPAESLASVLAACERARYAPPDLLPSADAWRDALSTAEQIVAR